MPATDWCDQIAWVAAMRPTTGGQLGCTTALPPLGHVAGPPPSPHSVFHWSRDLKDLLLAANQHQQHQQAKLRLTLRLHLDSNLVRWQVLPSPVVQMLPSLVAASFVLSCCGKCCPLLWCRCCPLLWWQGLPSPVVQIEKELRLATALWPSLSLGNPASSTFEQSASCILVVSV